MKKLFLLISFFIIVILRTDAQCSSLDSIKYEKAYNYIVNDSVMIGKTIFISKKLTDPFFLLFSKCFEENRTNLELMRKLYEKDMNCNPINKNPCLKSVYFKVKYIKSADMFLEFSEIIENSLFVSIRTNLFHDHNFEQTYHYYFYFDDNGAILRVSKEMMYGL